ncbi:MAG: hypothetical protein WC516_06455 [Patescibacteria group bacterium]|jgi:hypothetical protein
MKKVIVRKKPKLIIPIEEPLERVVCECGTLLFKAIRDSIGTIEIKCRKCKKINKM